MLLTRAPSPPVTVPMRRLRATLRSVLRAVEESRERVVLTRRGRPVAALVPFGALAALDLLGRMLPSVQDVTAGLQLPAAGDPAPGALTLGGPPPTPLPLTGPPPRRPRKVPMVATTDPTSLGRFGLVQPIVETTMAVYADLTALDLRGAVERAAGAVVAPRAAARSG